MQAAVRTGTGRWRKRARRWALRAGLFMGLGAGSFSFGALAAPQQARPTVSANGLFTIRYAESSPGHCLLEIAKDDGPTYKLPQCVGAVDDLFFVSNDGEKFWVLHAVPKVPDAKRFRQHPERWGNVVVATLYARDGKVLGGRRLSDFVKRGQTDKLRDLGLRFGWLAGVSGASGVAPRLTDDGVVELDTVADKRYRLGF